jgi:hypothetical protein
MNKATLLAWFSTSSYPQICNCGTWPDVTVLSRIFTLTPSSVIKLLPKVVEAAPAVEPVHLDILLTLPTPSNTDVLSIFCQVSVAPTSTNTAQSPTFQSVIPSRLVDPSTETT